MVCDNGWASAALGQRRALGAHRGTLPGVRGSDLAGAWLNWCRYAEKGLVLAVLCNAFCSSAPLLPGVGEEGRGAGPVGIGGDQRRRGQLKKKLSQGTSQSVPVPKEHQSKKYGYQHQDQH